MQCFKKFYFLCVCFLHKNEGVNQGEKDEGSKRLIHTEERGGESQVTAGLESSQGEGEDGALQEDRLQEK